jgi:hypothetical protein
MGGVKIYLRQFRGKIGSLTIMGPKGGRLLRAYQLGSGRWVAHILGPVTSEEEPFELFMMSSKGEELDLDMAKAMCVGHGESLQGRTFYVFQNLPPMSPVKRKPGRPRKAATPPPVDQTGQ